MIGLIILLVLAVLFFAWLGWFAWSSWSQRFGRSRLQVLVRLVESIALLAIARQVIHWGEVPIMWFVAIALLAAGVAGLAVRWRQLPWTGTKKRRRELVSGSVSAGISIGLIALVLS